MSKVNISIAEEELMLAMQNKSDPTVLFDTSDKYVDEVVADTNEQVTEIESLGEQVKSANKDNPELVQNATWAVEEVQSRGENVKREACDMKVEVDTARKMYLQAKKDYRREQHENNIAKAKEKLDQAKRIFDLVTDKTRQTFNKALDITKEAELNISAAKNTIEQNYHRSNLKKGLENIMCELASIKRGSVAHELSEAVSEKTHLEVAKSNRVAEVNNRAKDEAAKISKSFWHRARLGFSPEGRDRLRHPEKDVEMIQAKLIKRGAYKKELKEINKEFDKPIKKASKTVAELTEKKKAIDSRLANYREIMSEYSEKVSFKEVREQMREDLEKAKNIVKEAPEKGNRDLGEER